MHLEIEIQNATETVDLPSKEAFIQWAQAALVKGTEGAEVVIRIVDEAESRTLNRDYRGKDRPTNILSFPFEAPPQVPSNLLGDLVICAPVVIREAEAQNKSALSHWAHMTVHGMLHLQGFDHLDEDEAEVMETRERQILCGLGFRDPYEESSL
ncbi:MAG: rRNA maturation RNase YbeY [endosymbiont of Seepiophila jonesi]|uniref:Endoribonuclease YbeY n=1 Tax=endosymbiont of Lamellibrachia luymesi TaxID=2200907 RepID=A0A370DZ47_9GAMM|nr:MAG: rRNA maturation RNase YbeY [endosymbiont of Seepiophila jonesi]RDH91941.1 MAG: rRNA maturation RNase YbeY [endosymbiont of Lamellibrachia luymesi]